MLVLAAGCAPKVGLQPVPPREVGALALADRRDFAGLDEALGQSLRYFGRLPDDALFRYGDLTYNAREMGASTELFRRIVTSGAPEPEILREIRERFHFFESRNEAGRAFFTGYYEPVLPGSLEPTARYRVPLYAPPADLVRVDLGAFVEAGILPEELRGRSIRGRIDSGRLVPYDDRDRISWGRSLEGRAEALAWVEDEIELFFLQIQGSGLLALEGDGELLRVNYADQNGHPYRAIGRLLKDRIPPEEMSLQALKRWLRAHPELVREVLNYNPSYTFFRRVDEGPLGNIQVPLTPARSVAMDRDLVPRGGIVWVETSLPSGSVPGVPGPVPWAAFGVVQDTGGAIRGHGRVDIFWGSGEEGERLAGPMKERGRVFLLVARKEFLPPGGPGP